MQYPIHVCNVKLFYPQHEPKIVVGCEVLNAVTMKKNVVWNVAPCNLVEVYRRFGGTCCLHPQGNAAT
jgi:hypothetical protein